MPSTTSRDGIVNPSAARGLLLFPPYFLAAVPICNLLAAPDGLFERSLNGFISSSAFIVTLGATSTVSEQRAIPALSAAYFFATYVLGAAVSASAIGMSSPAGRDNNEPRAQLASMRGMPLRMHSAVDHMMEIFPSYALVAGMCFSVAPANRMLINLLGVHVMTKIFLYCPFYAFNIGVPRGLAHIIATSSLLSAAFKLVMT